ncbi:MAG TPA: RluA family pseudouridine synthase [Bacteroidia bacterium]|nr:RluA family pseudouridine synthase [Bacteroidia bacterium]
MMNVDFLDVLYEDNHIIAINKKSGDIVQGDKTGDKPLSDYVKDYIKVKNNKPGEVFLGTVHRIDRPVSGIVLFAKTSKALARLNEMFQKKEITKTYWAVVKNKPPQKEGKLEHFLLKDEARNKSKAHVNQVKNSLPSTLEYSVIASSDKYFLLEINPHTGRHHQIRAQLSAISCPIKGDVKYGAERQNNDASIHLHARKVSFIHPVKKENITIVAAPPKDNLWLALLKLVS